MEIRRRTMERSLKYTFTEDERKGLAVDLSQAVRVWEEKEAQKKAITSQLKAEVDQAQSSMAILAGKHRDGYEYRQTKCEETRDFNSKTVTVIRLDSGEIIEERKMRNDELQMELDT